MLIREEKLSTREETSVSAFCSSDFCFCTAAAAAAAVGPGAELEPPPALLIAVVARQEAQRLLVQLVRAGQKSVGRDENETD
jgi:hypothetical protein